APQEDGVSRRRELEQELADEAIWLQTAGPVSDRARLLLRDAGLRQLFVVRTQRRPFAIEAQEQEVAELVLDDAVFPRERLGEIRDLDVHIEALADADVGAFGDNSGKDVLVEKLRSQRNGARSRLVDALDSRRFATLVNDMSLVLSQDGTAPHQKQLPVTQL